MNSEENVLGKGIEAIFRKTARLKESVDKTLELPNGTIQREGDNLIIRLNLGKDDDIRGAVEELANAARSGMLDQLVDARKIKNQLTEHLELAEIAIADKDFQAAIEEYLSALKISDNADIRYNLALTYDLAGDIDSAVKQYRKVLKKQPDAAYALNNLGLIYYHKGDLTRAMDYYHRAVQADSRISEKSVDGQLFAPRFGLKKIHKS